MNLQEFNEWWTNYCIAFPGTKQWLMDNSPDPRKTLTSWFKTLEGIEIGYAQAVTDKIVRGELAPLEAYEREKTALHIRSYAARLRDQHEQRRQRTQERTQFEGRQVVNFPAGRLYVAACRLWKQAKADQSLVTHEQRRLWVNAALADVAQEMGI